MKISELNSWPCTWFREERPFRKSDLLEDSSIFFAFGKNPETFFLAKRSDIAEVFLKDGTEEMNVLEQLEPMEYLILNLNDDLSSIPYIGKQEKFGLILDDDHRPVRVIMDIQNIYELHYALRMAIYHRDLQIEFYKRIIDNIEEEIFITDEYGFVQFLNPYAEKVCGVTLSEVVGWHVDDLERNGIISSSMTKEVFRHHKTCNRMVELHTGEVVLATGIPLYSKNGSLCNVLSTSKNVAELRNVLTHLEELAS